DADLEHQRRVVDAFLAAARGGDFEALLAVLDPGVVLRADAGAGRPGPSRGVRGARIVARGAILGAQLEGTGVPVVGDGAAGGVAWAPDGRPISLMAFTVAAGRIVEIDVFGAPARLRRLDLAALRP